MLGERIAPQSEAIRAIVSGYSPCCVGSRTVISFRAVVSSYDLDILTSRTDCSRRDSSCSFATESPTEPNAPPCQSAQHPLRLPVGTFSGWNTCSDMLLMRQAPLSL